MTFELELKNFKEKAIRRANLVARKIILDVGRSLVLKSPVGDPSYWKFDPPPGYVGGRFRANWQYGDAVLPEGFLDTIDPNGGNTIAGFAAKIKVDVFDRSHYLINNLPYAKRLEEGWSRQAPYGMVALTVNEFRPIAAAASRELSK